MLEELLDIHNKGVLIRYLVLPRLLVLEVLEEQVVMPVTEETDL